MKDFEEGDVVYDSIMNPGQEGRVSHIDPESTYEVRVVFDSMEYSYTKGGRYYERALPTLSHSRYTVVKTGDQMLLENFFKL